MTRVIPLLIGNHESASVEKGVFLSGHTSSATLIQSGEMNLLVDTGGRGYGNDLIKAIREQGVDETEINTIILTHFHLDHTFNIHRFPGARIIGWRHEWEEKGTLRLDDIMNANLPKGVKLMSTPGHTPEHLSVIVHQEDGRIMVIAGDAINHSYVEEKKVTAFCYDKGLYIESADKILDQADLIIPGHGTIIEVL